MQSFSMKLAALAAAAAMLLVPGCKDKKDTYPHGTCPTPEISDAFRYCISEDGGTLRIEGTSLGGDGVDEVRVTIGDASASSVSVTPATEEGARDVVDATFDAFSSTGEQTLVVTNVCGETETSGEFVAVVTPALEITGIEPDYGDPCGGTTVTISGRGFTDEVNVWVTTYQEFFTSFAVGADGRTITGVLAANPEQSGKAVIVTVEYIYEGCDVMAEHGYNYAQSECAPEETDLTELPAIAGHQVVGVGDFNDDSNNDIVVAHFDTREVLVFEGAGDGTFPEQYSLSLGSGDEAVALDVTDLDGDGLDDVVIAVQGNDDAVSLLQSGGELVLHDARGEIGGAPFDIVAAQLNGDAHMDVVTVSPASNMVSFMFGDGTGGFPTFDGALISGGVALAAGEPDASTGLSDVYMATSTSSLTASGVTTIRNLSSGGTFSYSPAFLSTSTQPLDLIYYDTDYTSGPEVITADGASRSITFVSGFADGVPTTTGALKITGDVYRIAGGHFQSTGDAAQLAILSADVAGGQLRIMTAAPTKMFVAEFPGMPVSVATGDLDGDGLDDIVVGRDAVDTVLLFLSSE